MISTAYYSPAQAFAVHGLLFSASLYCAFVPLQQCLIRRDDNSSSSFLCFFTNLLIWNNLLLVMAEKGEASSYEDTGESIRVDGLIKKMESLDYENSNGEASLSTSEAGYDNINEVIPSLLPEIISDILSRLPIEDIIRYKIVSKEWYALTKDPHFVDMHLRRSLCLPHRLILQPNVKHSELISNLCLIDRESGMWRGRDIPIENLPEKFGRTICSCHGFLCVPSSSSKVDPLFIYNPILRESVELPKTDIDLGSSFVSVGFGYDPINKKYKLVRFFTFFNDDNVKTNMKGEIITLGEASWRELEVSNIIICNPNAKAVLLDDALHWIIDRDSEHSCDGILILDLSNEKFRTIKIPPSVRRSIQFPYEVFLLNLGGCLALIEHGYWEKFHVWRIARANTKTGYKFYQVFYRMTIAYKLLILGIKLKDKLIDNSFLFHVRRLHPTSRNEAKDHFALYYPEQDEHRIVDASGIPNFFESVLFIPCLVSPCAAFGI